MQWLVDQSCLVRLILIPRHWRAAPESLHASDGHHIRVPHLHSFRGPSQPPSLAIRRCECMGSLNRTFCNLDAAIDHSYRSCAFPIQYGHAGLRPVQPLQHLQRALCLGLRLLRCGLELQADGALLCPSNRILPNWSQPESKNASTPPYHHHPDNSHLFRIGLGSPSAGHVL